MVENIPLYLLTLRKEDDRSNGVLGTGKLTSLEAAILKNGVLNPLTVVKRGHDHRVLDGSLRLTALRNLRYKRKIPTDYPVPCLVYEMTAKEVKEYRDMAALSRQSFRNAQNLMAHQEEIVREALKRKATMFAVSTPRGDDKMRAYYDFANQNTLALHDGIIMDECSYFPEKRSWRLGEVPDFFYRNPPYYRDPDWAVLECNWFAGMKPATLRHFDLGEDW